MAALVICGYGRVGTAMVSTATMAGQTVTVVDLPGAPKDRFDDGVVVPILHAPGQVPDQGEPTVWHMCVPDQALSGLLADIAAGIPGFVRGRDCVAVASATIDTDTLSTIAGLDVGRAHPLYPFGPAGGRNPIPPGTPMATHDIPAFAIDLMTKLGFATFSLDPGQRHLYHAAAVLSCNLGAALADTAGRIFDDCGVPNGQSVAGDMLTSLANLVRNDGAAAVPGPAARGDLQTVARDQAALDQWDTDAGTVHRILTDVILQMVADSGRHRKE